jgi:PPK2 family polyphosphate:nucleotide phosphotransferase
MSKDKQMDVAKLVAKLRVEPGATVSLARDFDAGHTAQFVTKKDAVVELRHGIEALTDYQARLAAQDTYALLIVIQALDAAGKDGTIKHVMSGLNPQGVSVTSFKVPSTRELQHDFLWRYQRALPERGKIAIFNRSHYEEVLVVRVHADAIASEHLPPKDKGKNIWQCRYRDINNWERYLVDNGIRVVKLLLNLSKEEQRQRFLARIAEPDKNWKFSAADARERRYWDDYQKAFSEMLNATSTPWAPWHVIPADHKWFTHLAVADLLVHELAAIDPRYPVPSVAQREEMSAAKRELDAE